MDNILRKGTKLIVLDYKTRGFPLKEDTAEGYQDQMDIYNFLLRKNGYETEDYAYLLFYHPSDVDKLGRVIFHTDLVKVKVTPQNAEKLMKEAFRVLGDRMPKAGKGCGFCGWTKECEGV